MLAAAGLLDGRRAVTHWEFCRAAGQPISVATVDPRPIFIHDDPIWTSAGVTSGIDLSLALVEEDLDRAVMLTIARRLVVFPRRPGDQAQFSDALTLQAPDHSFAELHALDRDNLTEDLSLRRAVRPSRHERANLLSSLSRRDGHDARPRGRTAAGSKPPGSFCSDTHFPTKRIAVRCGFGSEETLRRAFLRVHGVGPKDYRERFRLAALLAEADTGSASGSASKQKPRGRSWRGVMAMCLGEAVLTRSSRAAQSKSGGRVFALSAVAPDRARSGVRARAAAAGADSMASP